MLATTKSPSQMNYFVGKIELLWIVTWIKISIAFFLETNRV